MRDDQVMQDLLTEHGAPIAHLLADPSVTEICINRFDRVWVERAGELERVDARWHDERALVRFIKQIGVSLDQEVDEEHRPILDARLPDGTRFNAALQPISVGGASASLRPFPKTVFTLDDLMRFGAVTQTIHEIFDIGIRHRLNVIVAGGTGSGKTTILRCLAQLIPERDRVLTVEDTCENLLPGHPHCVMLEAPRRRAGADAMVITLGSLIGDAMRKRPDRIVVGEIRTPEAAAAFVEALNTGHDGTLTTIHANSGVDALIRVQTLYARQASNFSMSNIEKLVNSNVDLVIQAVREHDGDKVVRRVKELLWVRGADMVQLVRHRRGYVHDDAALDEFMTTFG